MKRAHSELFAPYRFLGVVSGEVSPSVRSIYVGKHSTISILCPVDNTILHYNGKKLRPIGASNPFPNKISAITSSSSCVFAAHGKVVSALPFCRNVTQSIEVYSEIKMMILIGENLVAIDSLSGIRVIDTVSFTTRLYIEGGNSFVISAIIHPSTYLNKVLVGSTTGHIRLVNIRTGKVVHDFQRDFGSTVTVLKQTTALDVIAIGLESGKVLLYHIKLDKVLNSFCHDSCITGIAFRDDGQATMVTADEHGTIAVWSLEKQELIGKLTDSHSDSVNCLHFISGEPVMISASVDNSLRLWIFDSVDGMPRELARADGHRSEVSSVKFLGKTEILSAGKDGSIRKHDVSSLTMRQNLGSFEAEFSANRGDINTQNVVDMTFGWQREASWSNVFCRHSNQSKVTAWQTRNNTRGRLTLEHARFRSNVSFSDAAATAVCLSPCGNSVFIGYSTGHIDQFNAQSGRHVCSFHSRKKTKKNCEKKIPYYKQSKNYDSPASESKITSICIDKRGKELISTDEGGSIVFWSISSQKPIAKLKKSNVKLGMSLPNPTNSLIAVVTILENGDEIVLIIDSACHRPVREFLEVGKKINALEFSSDGKWLLVADNDSYIRVFDISTSNMIDVLLFSKPCTALSFNETGEFLATVHEGEQAVYVWANKSVFLSHVNICALDSDFLPTWRSQSDEPDVCIDDDDDTVLDDEIRVLREKQIDKQLITFSGLPSSRWANLPDLSLIKERNRPAESIKKIKQAPFFLSAAQTLIGFEFQTEGFDENASSKFIKSKRDLLELETSFSSLLKRSKNEDDLLQAFQVLQKNGLSFIDFQIRSMTSVTIPTFLRMLLEVLKSRKQFELVQSYLTTVMKIHREYFWKLESDRGDSTKLFTELLSVQKCCWEEVELLSVENKAIIQWIKNALL